MFVYSFITLILLFKPFLNLLIKLMETHEPILPDMLSNLPVEILNDIFSRIPAKSVGKFRCLSKTWHTFLSTPHFINSHLSCKTHQQSLILLTEFNSLYVINLPIENPIISNDLELGNYWTRVLGSCNGLVLLLSSKEKMFLLNPTTFELFKVPNLTIDPKVIPKFILRGIGYDSTSDDYKIIVISPLGSITVDLYSLKSGVWRRINHSLYRFSLGGSPRGVFINGAVHWYTSRGKSRTTYGILSFDLATEVFHEIDTPPNIDGPEVACGISAHEERLCAYNLEMLAMDDVTDGPFEKINVWMMNEYGIVNSWKILGTIKGSGNWFMYVPLYFSGDEEIVLINNQKTMIVCNLKEGTEKALVVYGVSASFCDGCSFVSSLVSLKGYTSSS